MKHSGSGATGEDGETPREPIWTPTAELPEFDATTAEPYVLRPLESLIGRQGPPEPGGDLRHLHAATERHDPPQWSQFARCACPKGCAVRVPLADSLCERCAEECAA